MYYNMAMRDMYSCSIICLFRALDRFLYQSPAVIQPLFFHRAHRPKTWNRLQYHLRCGIVQE